MILELDSHTWMGATTGGQLFWLDPLDPGSADSEPYHKTSTHRII